METWIHVMMATLVAHSDESAAAAAMYMLTSCVSVAAICDRVDKEAQTAAVASQVAAATSASGIATGESGTTAVRSAVKAVALMEAAHDHVEAAHAQLLAVTAQIERSFSDNGRQPTAEELAIAESIRAVVRSSAAYLATTEPVQAQIASAHAQLVAAFSKEMADADGEMLVKYGAMDAMEPLPQETVGRELDMEAATEIDEHQP